MLPSFGKLYKLQEINSKALGNVVGSTVRITGRYGVWHHIHKFTCMFDDVIVNDVCHTDTVTAVCTPPIYKKKNYFFSLKVYL